jgi:hypothetical protein
MRRLPTVVIDPGHGGIDRPSGRPVARLGPVNAGGGEDDGRIRGPCETALSGHGVACPRKQSSPADPRAPKQVRRLSTR